MFVQCALEQDVIDLWDLFQRGIRNRLNLGGWGEI